MKLPRKLKKLVKKYSNPFRVVLNKDWKKLMKVRVKIDAEVIKESIFRLLNTKQEEIIFNPMQKWSL